MVPKKINIRVVEASCWNNTLQINSLAAAPASSVAAASAVVTPRLRTPPRPCTPIWHDLSRPETLRTRCCGWASLFYAAARCQMNCWLRGETLRATRPRRPARLVDATRLQRPETARPSRQSWQSRRGNVAGKKNEISGRKKWFKNINHPGNLGE